MNGPADRLGGLVVKVPARRAGDPGSIPGPGENFSLKLLIYDLSEGYSKARILLYGAGKGTSHLRDSILPYHYHYYYYYYYY